LFCKNERAAIRTTLSGTGHRMTLVPVAAILVAGIRLRFLELTSARRQDGRRTFWCNASLRKGEEMGWFEHGSTIVVLAPEGFSLSGGIQPGMTIRVGQPLMKLPDPSPTQGGTP
jgi:phosphatidylserine decarboxylase